MTVLAPKPRHVLTSIALLALATPLIAAPFGLRLGAELSELKIETEPVVPGKYIVDSVPRPHSAFDKYVLQVAPQIGLCWIKAIGNEIATSSHGIQLRTAFEDMQGKLASSYGDSELTDFLLTGSLWDAPEHFMMGLLKKERLLAAEWSRQHGSELPEDIDKIFLAIQPSGTDSGFLVIEYSLSNFEACEAAIARQEDSAL
ncbi:MAG: hypothetical protein AAGE94_18275 [Acidobacteriota bacterium]